MRARLFCKTGELAGTSLGFTTEASIGRSGDNDMALAPYMISSHHARIYFDDEQKSYVLEDLDSRNGTRLDGMSLNGAERLGRLHVVTFAERFDFIFQDLTGAALLSDAPPADPALKTQVGDFFAAAPTIPAADEPHGQTQIGEAFVGLPNLAEETASKTRIGEAFAAPVLPPGLGTPPSEPPEDVSLPLPQTPGTGYYLEVTEVDGSKTRHALKEGGNVLGRSSACDITLFGASLTRQHARLTITEDGAQLEDLGSKNGTFIEGERISAPVKVAPGTPIRLGVDVEVTWGHQTSETA